MNRLRSALFACITLLGASFAHPQAAFYWNLFGLDKFAYSNGNLTGLGNWTTPGLYVTLVVAGNTVQCSSIGSQDCRNYYNSTFPNDQCSQVQINTLNATSSGQVDLGVRESASADTYYFAGIKGALGAGASILLAKRVAGSTTTLVAYQTETINSGDLVGICAQGTSIYVTIRGTKVSALIATDSAITSGFPSIGIESNGQAQTDVIVANWSGFYLGTTIASSGGGGGSLVKWNPGHYIITDQRPVLVGALTNLTTAVNDMDGAFVSVSSRMTGLQVEPQWYQLETPAGGCYYFDPGGACYNSGNVIDVALADLAAKSASRSTSCGCSIDYKLIIYLPLIESLATGMPTAPQAAPYGAGASTKSIAPDYVISAGCVFVDANTFQAVKLYNATCMGYAISLVTKMGQVYDGNSHVEMVAPIYETAVNATNICDAGFSVANLTTQLNAMGAAMNTNWAHTQHPLFNNFGYSLGGPTPGCSNIAVTAAQLATITQGWIASTSAASNNGANMGGPDILYGGTGGSPTTGDQISRGLVGGVTYTGKVGLLWEEQANCFNWTSQTISGTETYAFGTLLATHEAWADIQAGEGCPWAYWSAVATYLQSVSFRINSARPSSYTWLRPANDDHFETAWIDDRHVRRAAANDDHFVQLHGRAA